MKLLTIKQAAEFLTMSESRVRYEVFRKNISFFKIGRSIRFNEADLVEWVLSKKKGVPNER